MAFTIFFGTHRLTYGRTDPKQNASGTIFQRWRLHKKANASSVLTYHANKRCCRSPADLPPKTRIAAHHVIQCVIVVVNTCRSNIVLSIFSCIFLSFAYLSFWGQTSTVDLVAACVLSEPNITFPVAAGKSVLTLSLPIPLRLHALPYWSIYPTVFNFWHSGTLALMTECQSAWMSKIKTGGLHQYGAESFEQQQFGTPGVEGVNIVQSFYSGP